MLISLPQTTPNDEFAYCGTTSGDILKLNLNYPSDLSKVESDTAAVLMGCYGKLIKKKVSTKLKDVNAEDVSLYSAGVTALYLLKDGERRMHVILWSSGYYIRLALAIAML